MAKCHRFVRSLSVGLNILLLVFGLLMIAVGFSYDADDHIAVGFPYDADDHTSAESAKWSRGHGILVLRIFGPITVILSVLGICASVKDVKALLILYSTVMFVEFVALMVVASPLIQDQAKMDSELEARFRNMTPLYEADPQAQTELYKLQASDHCCGLTSHADWKDRVPTSCLCVNSSTEEPCVHVTEQQPSIWVYEKPCGPILKRHQSILIKVNIGVISAFVTVMLTAMVVSLVLGLEEYWTTPPVEVTVDDNNRVKYQPKPSLTFN